MKTMSSHNSFQCFFTKVLLKVTLFVEIVHSDGRHTSLRLIRRRRVVHGCWTWEGLEVRKHCGDQRRLHVSTRNFMEVYKLH